MPLPTEIHCRHCNHPFPTHDARCVTHVVSEGAEGSESGVGPKPFGELSFDELTQEAVRFGYLPPTLKEFQREAERLREANKHLRFRAEVREEDPEAFDDAVMFRDNRVRELLARFEARATAFRDAFERMASALRARYEALDASLAARRRHDELLSDEDPTAPPHLSPPPSAEQEAVWQEMRAAGDQLQKTDAELRRLANEPAPAVPSVVPVPEGILSRRYVELLEERLRTAEAERDKATAEAARLQHRLDSAPPWTLSTIPTDAELWALYRRWGTGPERYQGDADMMIHAIRALREAIEGRTTPPTAAERLEHLRATHHKGLWRVVSESRDVTGDWGHPILQGALNDPEARWWPLDESRRIRVRGL